MIMITKVVKVGAWLSNSKQIQTFIDSRLMFKPFSNAKCLSGLDLKLKEGQRVQWAIVAVVMTALLGEKDIWGTHHIKITDQCR